jgi:hypothetical protein
MDQQWHLLQDGQQFGPYTADQLVEYAGDGRIVRDSMLWTEGLADWIKASEVDGLFPAAPVAVPVAVAAPAYVPGGNPPPWMRGGAAVQAPMARPVGAIAATRPGMMPARPGMGLAIQAVPGENYPPTDAKGAWFGLMAAFQAIGGGLLTVWLILFINTGIQIGQGGNPQLPPVVIIFVAAAASITALILQLIYISRLWSCLRFANPRTTPGKAVGFLFIPLFNFYWIFVAFYGLSQDWNRITSQHPDLVRAPKMSEGLFLAYCICRLVAPPVAFILWFIVMSQVCRSINAMVYRPTLRPGIFNIR